jgi:hypothetical protein
MDSHIISGRRGGVNSFAVVIRVIFDNWCELVHNQGGRNTHGYDGKPLSTRLPARAQAALASS